MSHHPLRSHRIIALIGLLLAVALGVAVWRVHDESRATPVEGSTTSSASTTASSHALALSFRPSAAPGWSAGPSNATSLVVFEHPQDCFVSLEIKGGVAGPNNSQATFDNLRRQGYFVTPGMAQPLALQTSAGTVPYALQPYTVRPAGIPDASTVYAGQEFAVAQLPGEYVNIQGYCVNPADLATTNAALTAVSVRS